MNDIFERNIRDLKSISIDNHDPKRKQYMTNSEVNAVDFDAVKDNYVDKMNLLTVPPSVDALMFLNDGDIMIEFKNGVVDKKLVEAIVDKMLNSVIIYSDITKTPISAIRKNVDFILVYNYQKNPGVNHFSNNFYRDEFVKSLSKKANRRYTQFGLFRYENYIFRNIYTYSKKDFKREFTDKL